MSTTANEWEYTQKKKKRALQSQNLWSFCINGKFVLFFNPKPSADKCCTLSKRFFMGVLGPLVVVVVQILN